MIGSPEQVMPSTYQHCSSRVILLPARGRSSIRISKLSGSFPQFIRKRPSLRVDHFTSWFISPGVPLEAHGLKLTPVHIMPRYLRRPRETRNIVHAIFVVSISAETRVSVCANVAVQAHCMVRTEARWWKVGLLSSVDKHHIFCPGPIEIASSGTKTGLKFAMVFSFPGSGVVFWVWVID